MKISPEWFVAGYFIYSAAMFFCGFMFRADLNEIRRKWASV